MSDQQPKVVFESSLDPRTYDLDGPDLLPHMMDKLNNNVQKFGSAEGWASVLRQEVFGKKELAERYVNSWWAAQRQLEFVERYIINSGSIQNEKLDIIPASDISPLP